jgi:lysophospholipase L1-like esterase
MLNRRKFCALAAPMIWAKAGASVVFAGEVHASQKEASANVAAAESTAQRTLRTLRISAEQAGQSNCHIKGVLNVPPAILALGTSLPPELSQSISYTKAPDAFHLFGGTPIVVAGLRRIQSATIAAKGGNLGTNKGAQGSYWRAETVIDAAKIAFRVGPTAAPYRFIVDEQYVDLKGTQTLSSRGATWEYILLDFSSAGGRKRRRIAIEGETTCAFDGVWATEGSKVFPSAHDSLRMIVVGDSIVYGAGAGHLADGWVRVMADFLGIPDTWASGSGGTGWLAGPPNGYNFRERNFDWLNHQPDILVFAGGFNDRNMPPAEITTEVAICLRDSRRVLPAIPIFVFGVFAGATGPSPQILTIENAIRAGVAEAKDKNIYFIPVSADPHGAWISGRGKIGMPVGSGNSDTLTSVDGVHPSYEGHRYLGARSAKAIVDTLPPR